MQQKLQQQPSSSTSSSVIGRPSPLSAADSITAAVSRQQPAFISTFMPQQQQQEMPEKSYSSEPTPVVLSSAPKLYANRTVNIQHVDLPHVMPSSSSQIDISSIQFDVTQKLKKLKAEKSGPNPFAEAAIQAAKASSALQNFQTPDKRKKDKKVSARVSKIFFILFLINYIHNNNAIFFSLIILFHFRYIFI